MAYYDSLEDRISRIIKILVSVVGLSTIPFFFLRALIPEPTPTTLPPPPVIGTPVGDYMFIIRRRDNVVELVDATTNTVISSFYDIADAINYVSDFGGKIFVMKGVYRTSKPFKLGSNIRLEGEGRNTIIMLENNANTHIIYDRDGGENVEIANIVFDCNGQNQTDGADRNDRVCLFFSNKKNLVLNNVVVKNTRHGAGAIFENIDNLYVVSSLFENNGVSTSIACDHMWAYARNVVVANSVFNICTDVGTALDNAVNVSIVNSVYRKCYWGAFTLWNLDDRRETPSRLTVQNVVVDAVGCEYGAYFGKCGDCANIPELISISGMIMVGGRVGLDFRTARNVVIADSIIIDQTESSIDLRNTTNALIHGNMLRNIRDLGGNRITQADNVFI